MTPERVAGWAIVIVVVVFLVWFLVVMIERLDASAAAAMVAGWMS